MKTIVIYNSQTGFTKRYAQWIEEATGADCLELSAAKKKNMSAPSKFAMKMLVKTLKAKKNKTEQEQEMLKMISGSYDISDRKYIEPILECLGKGI